MAPIMTGSQYANIYIHKPDPDLHYCLCNYKTLDSGIDSGLRTGLWAHSFLICEIKETSKLYLVFLPGPYLNVNQNLLSMQGVILLISAFIE